jgi:hypothetical protein
MFSISCFLETLDPTDGPQLGLLYQGPSEAMVKVLAVAVVSSRVNRRKMYFRALECDCSLLVLAKGTCGPTIQESLQHGS